MQCLVASERESKQFDRLRAIILPAASGEMQVLAGHSEAFVLLRAGKIILEKIFGGREEIEIPPAAAYVFQDKVIVIL